MTETETEAGFSLMEMLIVIALIGLIATFVGSNLIRRFDQARVDSTKIQIRNLGVVLDDYRRVCNQYPTTDLGLDALLKPPATCKGAYPEGFLKGTKLPKDAWNNDFVYTSDGNKYTIVSLGADGASGGEGFNADISSDDL